MKKIPLFGILILMLSVVFAVTLQVSSLYGKDNPFNMTYNNDTLVNFSSTSQACNPTVSSCSNAYDRDWDTYARSSYGTDGFLYLNFSVLSDTPEFKYRIGGSGATAHEISYWNYTKSDWVLFDNTNNKSTDNRTFTIPEDGLLGEFQIKASIRYGSTYDETFYEGLVIDDGHIYITYIEVPKSSYVKNITIDMEGFSI